MSPPDLVNVFTSVEASFGVNTSDVTNVEISRVTLSFPI